MPVAKQSTATAREDGETIVTEKGIESDPDKPVEVYSTDNPIEADLIRNMLQSAGVRCELEGGNQGGLTGLGIMAIRLIVRTADQAEAKRLLDSMEHD